MNHQRATLSFESLAEMPDTAHFKKRRETWYVRLKVPANLIQTIGRKEIVRTLKTQDVRIAEQRKHAVLAELFEMFDRSKALSELTWEDEEEIAQREYRRTIEVLASEVGNDGSEETLDVLDLTAESIHEKIGGYPDRDTAKKVQTLAVEIGFPELQPKDWMFRRIANAYQHGQLAAHLDKMTSLRGREPKPRDYIIPPPIDPLTLKPKTGSMKAFSSRDDQSGCSLRETCEAYLADKQKDKGASVTNQTIMQLLVTYRLFNDYLKHDNLALANRRAVAEFLEAIGLLDPVYGRYPHTKTISLQELLKRFGRGQNRLSNRTLNRRVSALSSMWKWAVMTGRLDDGGRNP